MADTIIVYYSLEGNIDFLAQNLAEEIGADTYRIETVKEYPKKGLVKFLHGGRDVIKGFSPELKGTLPDLSKYSKVVLATPVWAAKPSAPLTAFIEKADFNGKKVSIFDSCAGGEAQKCIDIISESVKAKGATVCATQTFVNPLRKQEKSLEVLKEFASKIN